MKFCLVTTFYPPCHFGGDATFVERLATALGRRGHRVDVVHDADAYRALGGGPAPAAERPPANVSVHRLESGAGFLSPLATHQTGLPLFKRPLGRVLESGGYDVIHFHNASLIGPGAFAWGAAVKLYTIHEQWLICPLSLLWKHGRAVCDAPACTACCIRAGRPPQLWRATGLLRRSLRHIDRFLAPSRFVAGIHRARGLDLPAEVLPLFLDDLDGQVGEARASGGGRARAGARPYFIFVGRLVPPKGAHTLIGAFRDRPDIDLLVAGAGGQAAALREAASGLANVLFLGQVPNSQVRRLCRDAIAVLVPSLCYEVFPTVVLEAFAGATPVVARDLGGLAEMIRESNGGLLYSDQRGLREAIDRLRGDGDLRDALGRNGYARLRDGWSADAHMRRYFAIIDDCAAGRRGGVRADA
ncbi:MAG TPA: glycosyltransferase family 4 protein [Vicinamibacterales bacterium]|nr:glycosyltransferase family 4 protein [Vicinamibacterales bacterium]